MKLFIWKYKDTPQENYFSGDCTYLDKIQIENVLRFPSFNQEFNSETDFTELKTGNFSVRVSRLQTETSANGDTIEDFLFPSDKDNKFLCMFQVSETNILANIAGFIQIDSITIDCNNNGYYIEFNVIGILREFAEYYDGKNIEALTENENVSFYQYIVDRHWDTQIHWAVENQLSLDTKVGSAVIASTPLQRDLILNHSIDISQWCGFKDIALGLGFSFILVPAQANPFNSNTPFFFLYLFWRSDALQSITLQVLEHEKSISSRYNNKWVYQASRHHITSIYGLSRTDINGWMINADSIYNFDSLVGINSRPIFIAATILTGRGQQGDNIEIHPSMSELTIVQWPDIFTFNENLYNISAGFLPKINAGSITYPRIFVLNYIYIPEAGYYVDSGIQTIMETTAIPEYRFLLSGIKENKKLKVIYDTDLGLFSKFTADSKDYLIERISNMDIYNQTAVIDCIEI